MVDSLISILVIFALILISIAIASLIWRPVVIRSLEIKEKDQKLHKYELFNNVDLETVEALINGYITSYIRRYILYKFTANKVIYINQEDTNTLIKDVTTNIALDISDIYLYYISLLQAYDNDEELLMFIRTRVTNIAISEITALNAANLPADTSNS